jgi:hypothetical protein
LKLDSFGNIIETDDLPPSDEEYFYESEDELEFDSFGNIIEKKPEEVKTKNKAEDQSEEDDDIHEIKSGIERL